MNGSLLARTAAKFVNNTAQLRRPLCPKRLQKQASN